uniref:Small nuclear ribonucleoprotein E n=1 Tax=Buteo japonicus TaxID=224669 RepID=A0A8C0HIH1_9AVES
GVTFVRGVCSCSRVCRAVFRDSLKACAVACSPVKAERISEIVYHLKNDRGRNRNHAGELLPLNAEGEDNVVWRVYVPVVLSPSIVLQRSRIQVWLYEQVNMRLEGCIIGFDEYMNLVPDDAEEIHSKPKSRKELGLL